MTSLNHVRIVRNTVDEEVARLRTLIGRMEHRYELSSSEMEAALSAGTIRETAEIAKWWEALVSLRELSAPGATIGSVTTSSR